MINSAEATRLVAAVIEVATRGGADRGGRGGSADRDRGDLASVALLSDPVRRRLYDYVHEQHEPVGRDEAARATGISRKLAAFHLDRMADAGLFAVSYRRLSGRTGRGAGRPAKLYALTGRRIAVSFPPERHALAGQILAEAMSELRPGEDGLSAVTRVARNVGERLGAEHAAAGKAAHRRAGGPPGRVLKLLQQLGFEPRREGDRLVLRNCPFDELARANRDVVCGMNRALLTGVLSGLSLRGDAAEPCDPTAGDGGRDACCVTVSLGELAQ